MTVAVLFGLLAAVLFVMAGIFAALSPPPAGAARVHMVAWGLACLTVYFLLGGGAVVVGS